jgi:hypothetical protein
MLDKQGLPGQATQPWYPWPHYEALRLDEARHPHPRWSQAEETDIGTGRTRPTALYNGHSQVAALYDGSEV